MFFEPLNELGGFFLALAYGAGPGEHFIVGGGALDAAAGADDGAVVALAHAGADFGEAELGGLADEEHGDAAGEADGALPTAGHEVLVLEAEVVADGLEDGLGFNR